MNVNKEMMLLLCALCVLMFGPDMGPLLLLPSHSPPFLQPGFRLEGTVIHQGASRRHYQAQSKRGRFLLDQFIQCPTQFVRRMMETPSRTGRITCINKAL